MTAALVLAGCDGTSRRVEVEPARDGSRPGHPAPEAPVQPRDDDNERELARVTAETFLRAVARGDGERACSLLSEAALAAQGNKASCAARLSDWPPGAGVLDEPQRVTETLGALVLAALSGESRFPGHDLLVRRIRLASPFPFSATRVEDPRSAIATGGITLDLAKTDERELVLWTRTLRGGLYRLSAGADGTGALSIVEPPFAWPPPLLYTISETTFTSGQDGYIAQGEVSATVVVLTTAGDNPKRIGTFSTLTETGMLLSLVDQASRGLLLDAARVIERAREQKREGPDERPDPDVLATEASRIAPSIGFLSVERMTAPQLAQLLREAASRTDTPAVAIDRVLLSARRFVIYALSEAGAVVSLDVRDGREPIIRQLAEHDSSGVEAPGS